MLLAMPLIAHFPIVLHQHFHHCHSLSSINACTRLSNLVLKFNIRPFGDRTLRQLFAIGLASNLLADNNLRRAKNSARLWRESVVQTNWDIEFDLPEHLLCR